MEERITISFEMEKKYVTDMFLFNENLNEPFNKFLKDAFSSFLEIHAKNIKYNMKAVNFQLNEEKIEEVTLKYLKDFISKQNMENLQIAVMKLIFKEMCTNRKELSEAVTDALKSAEITTIVENIKVELRRKYLLYAISSVT